ncbi:archaea-specific SMC-related protein [Salinirubrum litoreum]|uniref:Archaea-specific SMC-related protein n=1 Tax=Salinirubrum litoreum TaxID=1126234 RepID=A0ABD5RGH4_9EURY|nr:archaea-specific SMC-related protein [Salinirubrum litoreum]
MSTLRQEGQSIRLSARNIGGIDETTVEFEPGLTILEGRNATNRTSLLQAIKAACGSRDVSIKSDTDSGEVELTVGGETFRRTLSREGGTIVASGDEYLDDPALAELFAFLLETNEARQAVARGEDLREVIVRPIDTTAIEAEIRQLESRKEQIDDRLDHLDEIERQLPSLEEDRTRVREKIEDKRDELEDVRASIDAAETDVESEREEQRAVEEKLSELQQLRSELEDVRYDIETERESEEALREERTSLEEDLEELPASGTKDPQEINREIDSLRSEREQLERKLTELNTVIQFNEEMLEESNPHLRSALDGSGETDRGGSPTDRLLDDTESVTCWTCGSVVDAEKIEDTLGLLQDVRSQTAGEMDEIGAQIDELESERREIEQRRQRRSDLRTRIDRIDGEIEDHEAAITALQERRDDLESTVAETKEELEALRTESQNEVLDLHEEANELEFELGRLQNKLESTTDQIDEIESELAEREGLESERQEVAAELKDLRTRIESIQNEAVEQFNTHMETVLDLLEYDNIDRVWIERAEQEVRQGRSKRRQPTFDLHIVRNPADGGAYEDVAENLSESEREVIGLVFALAGYLVHDVDEVCPFILLDSLEAFDSERIAKLVSYLTDHSEYLVVALLPEDAQALDEGQRILEI